jgi:ubiquinone/menaquinone biosynthesis C-methylase UbiE
MTKNQPFTKKEILRSPQRQERLEVQRVVELSLAGADIDSVLDIGTGTGLFAEAFASAIKDVAGIDSNPEMIGHAMELVPSVRFKLGSAEEIPFVDDAYDLVFLGHVLHETHSLSSTLLEAKRCSKKRVVVLEWPYMDEEVGPPIERRINPEKITKIA